MIVRQNFYINYYGENFQPTLLKWEGSNIFCTEDKTEPTQEEYGSISFVAQNNEISLADFLKAVNSFFTLQKQCIAKKLLENLNFQDIPTQSVLQFIIHNKREITESLDSKNYNELINGLGFLKGNKDLIYKFLKSPYDYHCYQLLGIEKKILYVNTKFYEQCNFGFSEIEISLIQKLKLSLELSCYEQDKLSFLKEQNFHKSDIISLLGVLR